MYYKSLLYLKYKLFLDFQNKKLNQINIINFKYKLFMINSYLHPKSY